MAEEHIQLLNTLVIPQKERAVLEFIARRCNVYGEWILDYLELAVALGHTSDVSTRQLVKRLETGKGVILRRPVITQHAGQHRNIIFFDTKKIAATYLPNPLNNVLEQKKALIAHDYRTSPPHEHVMTPPHEHVMTPPHEHVMTPPHEHVMRGGSEGINKEMRARAVGSVINYSLERERDARANESASEAVENLEPRSRFSVEERREYANWQKCRDGLIKSANAIARASYGDGSEDEAIEEYFRRKAQGTLSQLHQGTRAASPKSSNGYKRDTIGLNTTTPAAPPSASTEPEMLTDEQACEVINATLDFQLPEFAEGRHPELERFPTCKHGEGWLLRLSERLMETGYYAQPP
jgi:hypothetical protein